jgi:hypothetical protein
MPLRMSRPKVFFFMGMLGVPLYLCTVKKKRNFPHIKGKSEGNGCKVIHEEGLPINEEMRKYLVLNFLIYEENFLF